LYETLKQNKVQFIKDAILVILILLHEQVDSQVLFNRVLNKLSIF
jgi:hypothetical protein